MDFEGWWWYLWVCVLVDGCGYLVWEVRLGREERDGRGGMGGSGVWLEGGEMSLVVCFMFLVVFCGVCMIVMLLFEWLFFLEECEIEGVRGGSGGRFEFEMEKVKNWCGDFGGCIFGRIEILEEGDMKEGIVIKVGCWDIKVLCVVLSV